MSATLKAINPPRQFIKENFYFKYKCEESVTISGGCRPGLAAAFKNAKGKTRKTTPLSCLSISTFFSALIDVWDIDWTVNTGYNYLIKINHFVRLKRSRADGFLFSPPSPAAATAALFFSSFCFSSLARMAT